MSPLFYYIAAFTEAWGRRGEVGGRNLYTHGGTSEEFSHLS